MQTTLQILITFIGIGIVLMTSYRDIRAISSSELDQDI